MELTTEQALTNLDLCYRLHFVGKLAEHVAMQQSLAIVNKAADEAPAAVKQEEKSE